MPSLASGAPSAQVAGHLPALSDRSAPPRRRRSRVQPLVPGELQGRWLMTALNASGSYGTTRNVLTALLLLANGNREVEASQLNIAAVAGTGLDRTRACLRELRKIGEVSIARQGGPGRRCNRYRLHLPLPETRPA